MACRIAFLVVFFVSALATAMAQQPQTIVLHNGKVITADDSFRICQAIAVRGNRILAVGTNEEVLKKAGAGARLLQDRKSTRLNSSHRVLSRMPSSA